MKRILVIATRQIGDVLLTTPLIRAARQRWPEARVDVLGFEGQMGMLDGNPDVDRCIATPPRLGLGGTWRLARQHWRRYDLALVYQPGDRAHVIGWIASSRRSGLIPDENGGSNWWKRALLRHAVVASGDRGQLHVVPEKLRLLAPWLAGAGGEESHPSSVSRPSGRNVGTGTAPVAVVPPQGKPLPEELATRLQPGYLVVHAPSMWAYKQWPVTHWVSLVRELLAEGHQVVLTGTAGERDQSCVAPLRPLGRSPQLVDATGQLGLGQLRRLIEGAALYIGPDTSITHLAAACGTPSLAVFGPTNPQRWGPWPATGCARPAFARHAAVQGVGNVTILQGPQDCIPCGRAGCDDHHHSRSDCLEAIRPERVLAEARSLLGRT